MNNGGNDSVLRRVSDQDLVDWSTDDWITIPEAGKPADGRWHWEPETLARRIRRGTGPRTELHLESGRRFLKWEWMEEWMATIPKPMWPVPRTKKRKTAK